MIEPPGMSPPCSADIKLLGGSPGQLSILFCFFCLQLIEIYFILKYAGPAIRRLFESANTALSFTAALLTYFATLAVHPQPIHNQSDLHNHETGAIFSSTPNPTQRSKHTTHLLLSRGLAADMIFVKSFTLADFGLIIFYPTRHITFCDKSE